MYLKKSLDVGIHTLLYQKLQFLGYKLNLKKIGDVILVFSKISIKIFKLEQNKILISLFKLKFKN